MTDTSVAVKTLVEMYESRGDELRRCREEGSELWRKLHFIMLNYVESEDGTFTFPDGDSWECKVKGQ